MIKILQLINIIMHLRSACQYQIFHIQLCISHKKCINIFIDIFLLSLCETEEKGAEEKKDKDNGDEANDGQNEADKAPSAEVQVVSLAVHAQMR